MKTALILNSYSGSSYASAHETFSLISEESDVLPHPTAFIFGGVMDDEVEHGIIPSTKAAIGVEHGDTCTYISPTPTYDEMTQFPCEESHHHMSDTSDSTICDIESISFERMSVTTTSPTHESMPHILCEVESHLSDSTNHMSESIQEGVSEPQHLVSEVVDTACEATMISNDLPSTPSVFSSLVLDLQQDEAPILDESIPPMGKPMAMVDDDAPPHLVPSRRRC
jgi:hypothetical protein